MKKASITATAAAAVLLATLAAHPAPQEPQALGEGLLGTVVNVGVPVIVKNTGGLANAAGIANGAVVANGAGVGNIGIGLNGGSLAKSDEAANSGLVDAEANLNLGTGANLDLDAGK